MLRRKMPVCDADLSPRPIAASRAAAIDYASRRSRHLFKEIK